MNELQIKKAEKAECRRYTLIVRIVSMGFAEVRMSAVVRDRMRTFLNG